MNIETIKMSARQAVVDTKVAGVVATGSAATGAGSWFEFIPGDIGLLASLIGLVLSMVLITTHVLNYRRQREKDALEIKLLHKKIDSISSDPTELTD